MFKAGDVVRVRDWPGTNGTRYLVEKTVTVPRSQFRKQVYAFTIEHWPGATYPTGRTGSFRAFPAELCIKDVKGTERWAR